MTDISLPCHGNPGTYDDGRFRVGDVVLAGVRNPIENRNSKGKYRPFVLVRRVDGHWRGMGLTTNSHYASGAPRVAIPEPLEVGLHGPGFLWGDHLTNVCALDIDRAIGKVTPALAEAVVLLAGLYGADAAALRAAAQSFGDAA